MLLTNTSGHTDVGVYTCTLPMLLSSRRHTVDSCKKYLTIPQFDCKCRHGHNLFFGAHSSEVYKNSEKLDSNLCRSCYARRPRMARKRSHQDFMDLSIDEPLSPILRPPRQTMHSNDSNSDGDEVMGTGIASPRFQTEHANEWALLDSQAAASVPPSGSGAGVQRPGAGGQRPGSAESAPTWGQVLSSLKVWGITPGSQSAAASPTGNQTHVPHMASDDVSVDTTAGGGPSNRAQTPGSSGRAEPEAERPTAELRAEGTSRSGAGLMPSRPASASAALGAGADRGAVSARQRSDRLSSSLDSSQVEPVHCAPMLCCVVHCCTTLSNSFVLCSASFK